MLSLGEREAYNVLLAIESPLKLTSEEQKACKTVDTFLRSRGEDPLTTVAGTIFPANHYMRHGAKGVYEKFPADFANVELKTWGTYAMRMLRREGKGGQEMNPLKEMIEKMQKYRHLNRSAFELNVLTDDLGNTGDLPIYDFKRDHKRTLQQPCLSHLTFKVTRNDCLRLTVFYRSHYYITKALGNLLGLAQLQSFVADQIGLDVGPLVCHSTHARIDCPLTPVKKLVAEVKAILPETRSN